MKMTIMVNNLIGNSHVLQRTKLPSVVKDQQMHVTLLTQETVDPLCRLQLRKIAYMVAENTGRNVEAIVFI